MDLSPRDRQSTRSRIPRAMGRAAFATAAFRPSRRVNGFSRSLLLRRDQALRASEIRVLIVRGSRRSSRPAGRACTLATLNR
jgi:hypothetical protein